MHFCCKDSCPQSWGTSNSTFVTDRVGDIEISFVEYSPRKKVHLQPDIVEYLKSPDGLKDAEWEKGQLSHRPPIPYVHVVDIVTPKEEPQIFKIKLPDASHLSMPINSRGEQ